MLSRIVWLLVFGRRRHWHERWMEYRLLAELIRQLRFLIPLGGGRPFPNVPAHLAEYGNLTQTWMHWHMRAIARATGIPQEKVTRPYVVECIDYLDRVVSGPSGGQLKFHKDTETRSHNIAHRLHWASTALFGLTFVGVGLHFALDLWEHCPALPRLHLSETITEGLARGLVLASAAWPALGAALVGISNQGEFARLAKRSAAMADCFEVFAKEVEKLKSEGKLSQVVSLAEKIAKVMVDEVSDWRVVFIDRPQTAA
jgi:hypothetical protein